MSNTFSRRDFLKKSSVLLAGTAVLGGTAMLTGCTTTEAADTATPEAPAFPFPYVELDAATAETIAFDGYYEGGCAFGVAKGMLGQLQTVAGYPFTGIPVEMYKTGKEGYGAGTLCGALVGAVNVISLCADTDSARELIAELFRWYATTPLPIYQGEGVIDVQTVANSINCDVSVETYKGVAQVEQSDPIRRARCGAVSADCARKAIELLNVHYGYMEAPVVAEPEEVQLNANEYLGEAEGYGGPIKVKVTMDGESISKIDVLSHSESIGISDPAFTTIPDAIIAAQSTTVDVAAGATASSNGIMAAVADALSKVGK